MTTMIALVLAPVAVVIGTIVLGELFGKSKFN